MTIHTIHISIHALLAESDANRAELNIRQIHFYPRSPCGERRHFGFLRPSRLGISIHALLAESDNQSNHTGTSPKEFLSTLSLRRATKLQGHVAGVQIISIHALLAESDWFTPHFQTDGYTFLSTLSLRRATPHTGCPRPVVDISIHALLAESDFCSCGGRVTPRSFLSTLSLRRATLFCFVAILSMIFLSTLSLRRATYDGIDRGNRRRISIHALLAESDIPRAITDTGLLLFLSTLSLRRATCVLTP